MNNRLFLYSGLFLVLILLYDAWHNKNTGYNAVQQNIPETAIESNISIGAQPSETDVDPSNTEPATTKTDFSESITVTTGAAPPSTNGTYLSNKYQDLLLYGSLVNAYGYLKGPPDMVQYYTQAYNDALQTYSIEQQGRRRRDEYQDGVIRTALKSPFPSDY